MAALVEVAGRAKEFVPFLLPIVLQLATALGVYLVARAFKAHIEQEAGQDLSIPDASGSPQQVIAVLPLNLQPGELSQRFVRDSDASQAFAAAIGVLATALLITEPSSSIMPLAILISATASLAAFVVTQAIKPGTYERWTWMGLTPLNYSICVINILLAVIVFALGPAGSS